MRRLYEAELAPHVLMLLAVSAFAICYLSSCAHGIDGAKQTLTNNALGTVIAFQTLDKVDADRQAAIRIEASKDATKANQELIEYIAQYQTARHVINDWAQAERDLSAGIASGKNIPALVAAVINAGLNVQKTLALWGVK